MKKFCKDYSNNERLKLATLRTSEGNVNDLAKLKQIINVGHALSP